MERDKDTATAAELLRALAYRAELALRADDPTTAADTIARARALTLTEAERDRLAETLAALEDLAAVSSADDSADKRRRAAGVADRGAVP